MRRGQRNGQRANHSPGTAKVLAEICRYFYGRGWVLGTSGNFSAVVSRKPLRLAITATGRDKGLATPADILEIDSQGHVIAGRGHPSSEADLHLAIVRERGAGAVMHTHSVWGTLLSDRYAADGGLTIAGYEMLKGLSDVDTHEHREWLPIVENSQDMQVLTRRIEQVLDQHPGAHGVLLRRHGLYTWGRDLAQAKRHAEILEFLLEVLGRHAYAAAEDASAGKSRSEDLRI